MPAPAKADRVCAVAAAAAHDLNDDLTVVLVSASRVQSILGPNHYAAPILTELVAAVLRCANTTTGLLAYSARQGAPISAATMEAAIEAA